LITEVDLTIEGEAIPEILTGMGHHLDSWTIETVIAIVLRLNHGVVFLAGEGISMTLAEVVGEGTMKAVVEVEEDEEGEEWAAEDLKGTSKAVVEVEEVEVVAEEVGDSSMIEEEEMAVDQTLVAEVEAGIDESPFEEWTACHCVMLKEIDHVTCHHEEMDPEIFLAMDQSETALEIYHEEMKCLEMALETCLEETNHSEMDQEIYQEEKKHSEMAREICLGEMSHSETGRENPLEEMNHSEKDLEKYPGETKHLEKGPENPHEETNHLEKDLEKCRGEMNRLEMGQEKPLEEMNHLEMAQEIFRTEMDLKNCNGMAQETFHEMLLEISLEEMSHSEKAREIFHEEKNLCEMLLEIQCEEMGLEISHEETR